MPKIYLSLGSNIKPEENLNKAKELLNQEYQSEKESKIYKTKSEGFEGEDFLNQVICLLTEDSPDRVVATLKDIEKKIGRKDRTEKFSDREIDIDLLLYGNYVGKVLGKDIPHKDIDLYRFVLEPLAEIAPDLIHPKYQEKISEIWQKKLNSFT
ncbi:MAG: 2-amino-4-hydroxy-6-hydroxymethyldihydropteridine diphosphokinase [SAR86 cluster bacterium]|uniref:2-amino-4-hydroxy-6-hydroxymethyldihydropteridine pyrophosphokinase n=1 Tax=SAR86 cluster bacterium TaxID=2030880 RepID=A0A937HZP5_9GAMM|nr:2-amino-4-hydroxy-6-hydroxymethyldihydropteridine diphosphokinase [SAR86 cluster bacterium]